MSLLFFGTTGQVARELRNQVPEARALSRAEADLTDPATCAAAIRAVAPTAVINAAAMTAVDGAESDENLAYAVNAKAPGAMARACAALSVPFVHISTDYVFDGSGDAPWTEDDNTGPLGVYGASKLAGEHETQNAGCPYGILRTSWVFSAHGKNFVHTMLRLSEDREHLSIVADQVGGPTPAADIAATCLALAQGLTLAPDKSGIYHFSGAPDVSWADFAREIFRQSDRNVVVEDIPTSAYPTPATRPMNSRLSCEKLRAAFGIEQPNWRDGLHAVLKETGHLVERK